MSKFGSEKILKYVQDWTSVTTNSYTLERHNFESQLCWCLKNCAGKFWNRGNIWYFHNPKDATFFALKWGVKYDKLETS